MVVVVIPRSSDDEDPLVCGKGLLGVVSTHAAVKHFHLLLVGPLLGPHFLCCCLPKAISTFVPPFPSDEFKDSFTALCGLVVAARQSHDPAIVNQGIPGSYKVEIYVLFVLFVDLQSRVLFAR